MSSGTESVVRCAGVRAAPPVALLTFALVCAPASAAPSLCANGESTLFDCPSGNERISICASRPWSAGTGWIQYRYGTLEKVEIRVPAHAPAATPDKTVVVGEQPLAGGGLGFVRFSSKHYRYTVYSAISEVGLSGGVAVEADGSILAVRRCTRGREGEFAAGLTDGRGFPKSAEPFFVP